MTDRPEWGAINFVSGKQDFDQAFQLTKDLIRLPLENLPDGVAGDAITRLESLTQVMGRIDSFVLEVGNPSGERDSHLSSLHGATEALLSTLAPWIPYLHYQNGDVAANINAIALRVGEAKDLVENARTAIASKATDLDEIITAAREASAAAGAAVFTVAFDDESRKLRGTSTKWLGVTAILALATLAFAVGELYFGLGSSPTAPGAASAEALKHFGGKVAVLIVLFAATLWCGRTYKALAHLSVVNRHRALSLQTFQAFSKAASDDSTKNAVLMEATRAVFGSVPTGFLESNGAPDQDVKIVEVFKSFAPKTPSA